MDEAGNCVCPPGTGLNANDECVRCLQERGQRIDDRGRCVCALERGMIIDERGNCVCPTEFGYKLDVNGHCAPCKLLYLLFQKLRMTQDLMVSICITKLSCSQIVNNLKFIAIIAKVK